MNNNCKLLPAAGEKILGLLSTYKHDFPLQKYNKEAQNANFSRLRQGFRPWPPYICPDPIYARFFAKTLYMPFRAYEAYIHMPPSLLPTVALRVFIRLRSATGL